MNRKILTIVAILLLSISCKKGKNSKPSNFDGLSREQIAAVEASMASQAIAAVSSTGELILQPGDVIVYRTNKNRFGKMQITSINSADNYKLTIKAVTFNDAGSIYKNTTTLIIDVNDFADLDEMIESSTQGVIDFFWKQINVKIEIAPMVGAKFTKYTF